VNSTDRSARHLLRVRSLEQLDLALAALEEGDPEPSSALASAVRLAVEDRLAGPDPVEKVAHKLRLFARREARSEFGDVPHPETAAWIKRAEELALDVDGLRGLAEWHANSWLFDDALATLEDLVSVAGPDHPNTLTSRHNLATWRQEVEQLQTK